MADFTNGFSVACVADGEYTISYEGVDKENQQTQAYEVATVVTVNDRNILSVARAESDNIIIDQGPAEGTPPAPVITNPDGGGVIYFTPGTPDSNQAPALLYSAKIKRQDDAELTTETVTVDQDNMEIAVTGTTAFVDYIVDVYGINEEGKGETASTSAFQLNYNSAEGSGSNYDYVEQDIGMATGQKWAVHTYRASGERSQLRLMLSRSTFLWLLAAATVRGAGAITRKDLSAVPVVAEVSSRTRKTATTM